MRISVSFRDATRDFSPGITKRIKRPYTVFYSRLPRDFSISISMEILVSQRTQGRTYSEKMRLHRLRFCIFAAAFCRKTDILPTSSSSSSSVYCNAQRAKAFFAAHSQTTNDDDDYDKRKTSSGMSEFSTLFLLKSE